MFGHMPKAYVIRYAKDAKWYLKNHPENDASMCVWTNTLGKAHTFTTKDLATTHINKYLANGRDCVVGEMILNPYAMAFGYAGG